MNRPINKGRKRFRYTPSEAPAARRPGRGGQVRISARFWDSLVRFQTMGLRMAGFLHQFKTPLHVIQSQAELLLEDGALSDPIRASLEMIRQNAGRLTAQTQSMMGLAAGSIPAAQAASVDGLLKDIFHAAGPDCRGKHITIEKELAAPSKIRMDAVALEGAIHNVVNNAIEAMPKGGVLGIRSFETSDQRHIGIEIRDTGPGMDRETLRKVLGAPFQTSKANGTGLGIYIARYILRRHRASIKWQSQVGQGTKVTILFPKLPREGDKKEIRRSIWRRIANAFAVLLVMIAPALASRAPQFLRLQGRFTDAQVAPLTDNLPVHFSIWDAEEGNGNLLWQAIQSVNIHDNTFQVVLGRLTPLPPAVFSGGDRWLEMQIANDAPLRPRHKIPYQFIQAQIAAPPVALPSPVVPPPPVAPPPPLVLPPPVTPAPAAITPEAKRELELQIEKYKEEEPAEPAAPKAKHAAALPRRHPKAPPRPAAPAEDSGPGNVYTVKAGDTLKNIAQRLYGNAELWYDLYYLNRDRLGPMGHLFTGQILVLPAQAPGEPAK